MGLTTIRRLAILLATILVASGLIYLIQRYQVARMARDLREQARQAVKEGNTIDAIRLYQEHLEVVPKDQQAKLEYADALLKAGKTPPQQQMAIQIYEEVLNRTPGDLETRRRLAELLVETARWQDASLHLAILLRSFPDDGHLRFLLGTCSEQLGNLSEARDNYQRAIDQGAPERLEALQRLASLLRSEFKNPAEADRKIEEMVQSAPDDYRVYLERGRYRRRFSQTEEERKAAIDDYQKALAGAPERAEIYVELAEIFREASNLAQARHYLEAGLKAVPGDPSLYSSLALLDYATGDMNKAIADLQEGLKVLPDAANLHWLLAMFLADRGSANELRLQIDELKRIGYPTILLDFLEAHYQVNAQRWREASQILTRIQRDPNYEPRFPAAYKARLNTLLARCYAQLGDFEKERDARLRAYRAAPDDLRIRLGLVESLVKQGELDQAIDEYKKLAGQLPQVRGNLVRLLLARNQQRPAAQRNWTETQRLLDEMARDQPQASEPMILQAQMLLLQGKTAEAEERLKAARLQLPQDANLWAASAALLRGQGKYDEALEVLEQARRLQGAKVPLLLEQARTLVAQDRPDVIGSLNALVETSSSLPREDRVRLLEGLAGEFSSLKDHARAVEIWTMVTRDDPGNLLPWIRLLDAAFASSSEAMTPIDATLKATVERALGEIRRLDTSDGLMSRYQEVRYAIWQAQHASDPIARETFRTRARSLLNELNSRRPDWSILPLAQASLAEQELAELMTAEPAASIKADEEKTENTPASDDRIRRKQDELANLYLQAIDRGQRSLLVLRRATEMLYASGRSAEVNQLWDRLPTPGLMPDSLQRMALDIALRNRDYERALDLARKAVQANPESFQERLWLVQVLIATGRQEDAEAELRKSVELAPADPSRWITLVQYLAQTRQPEKAERVVRDAEKALPKDQLPMAMATCCEAMGRAYQGVRPDRRARWLEAAGRWYQMAREAQPDDPVITRQFSEHLLRTGQLAAAEAQLRAILDREETDPRKAADANWARRTLALTLVASGDYAKAVKALAVVEPIARAVSDAGAAAKPEDLQVLARVYQAQKTPEFEEKGLQILEDLAAKNVAEPEDRFLLARAYSDRGDWKRARDEYRALLLRVDRARTSDVFALRPLYLAQYISELLQRHQTGQGSDDLEEAQELIEKLKQSQSDSISVLALEARLLKARGETDRLLELLRSAANRRDLPETFQGAVARLAEEMGQLELAEQLFRRLAETAGLLQSRLALAGFLARRDRVQEAIDLLEQLWTQGMKLEDLVRPVTEVLFASGAAVKPDSAQIERVAGWFQKGLEENPKSADLLMGLGTLRERQGRFQDAETIYRRAISQGGGDVVSLNNLAWLMALRKADSRVALDLINRAIALKGPLPEFLDTRAIVYLSSGQSQRAIEDLERAVAAAPSAAKYFHLAQAYLEANNKDAARQNLAKAREQGLAAESLHPLEVTAYQQVIQALETP